jgi:hypothetical protein
MTAIESCRTAALGGHVEQCDDCGHQRISFNSCRAGQMAGGSPGGVARRCQGRRGGITEGGINLCLDCVGEDYLKGQIAAYGKRRKCSYCGAVRRTFSIQEMADHVDRAFEQHYQRTPDHPSGLEDMLHKNKESTYEWERDGEPIVYAIMNAAAIPKAAAADIQSVLDDRHGPYSDYGMEIEFSSGSHYQEKDADNSSWLLAWREFESSLKTEARFFSRSAVRLLKSVFDGIDRLETRDGRSLIVKAGPDCHWHELYRARVFQSEAGLGNALIEPDRYLGSPAGPVGKRRPDECPWYRRLLRRSEAGGRTG